MRILIAEDHPDSRLLLQKILETAGHQVSTAVHGQEALEKAQAQPPELIISDILMPVMDGFNLCYTIKNDPQLCQIPFIFYTATYIDQEDERLALGVGASRYIVKPIEPQELLRHIDEVIAAAKNDTLSVPANPQLDPLNLFKMCGSSLSRKLESKVRELNLFKNIYQQSKSPTSILSPQGLVLQCNPAHTALFGYPEADLQGKSAAACLGEACLTALLKNAAEQKPYQAEIKINNQAGEQLSLALDSTIICDEAGGTAAISVSYRDQTRKRADESKLQQFRNMVELSNDAIFILEVKTSRFLDVNQKACERWGYSRDELLKLGVIDINPSYQSMADWQRMAENMKNTPASIREATHQTKSGERFPVEISWRYVKNEGGDYVIAVARDISERKNAEAQQRKARQEWDQTFDAIADIITIQDLDYRITQCNRAACIEFGLEKEQIIGQTCHQLFENSATPCADCPAPREMKEFTPHTEEKYHPRLDKTFSVSIYPLVNDGEITNIVHFAEDISNQKKLEAQLRQAQKMESLGTLAGGIAHDFNNILSAILGYAHLAQAKVSPDSKIFADLQQVLIGGKRAAELVRQILAFSRKADLLKKPVRVQDILQEALKLLRASIPMTIELRHNIDSQCQPILADATQINQIVMNLCTNALHALEGAKTRIIEVSLSPVEVSAAQAQQTLDLTAGSYLLLTVTDTGTGIDAATLEKIFDPYFTTKGPEEGTGLGLAVVHGIVKSHGGHVIFYSEPGAGTSCKVYLPATALTQPVTADSTPPTELPRGSERILLVDDEESICVLMETILQGFGYQVTRESSSVEALSRFKEQPDAFDLVLTDLSMPEMDGIELATKIRAIRAEIPIILCTGFTDSKRINAAQAAGINYCLMKPFADADLLWNLRKLLDNR